MGRTTVASTAIGQITRLRLGERNKLADLIHLQRGVYEQNQRQFRDQANGHERGSLL
jgi:hypothetical protein